MRIDKKHEIYSYWSNGYLISIAVSFYLIYYMVTPLHHYLLQPLQWSAFFMFGIPALFGMCGITLINRKTVEYLLLELLWGWIVVTRFLNGDWLLKDNADYIVFMSLMVLGIVPGLVLTEQSKQRYFNVISMAIILFYMVLGVLGVYIGITHRELINPLDQYRSHLSFKQWRLGMLGFGSNETGELFLVSFSIVFASFLGWKGKLKKTILIIAAIVDFLAISLTRSRNAQINTCLILGIFFAILAVRKLSSKPLLMRILAGVLLIIIVTTGLYQMFEPCRKGMWKAYSVAFQDKTVKNGTSFEVDTVTENQSTEAYTTSEEEQQYVTDTRTFLDDTGRLPIYRGAIDSLKSEPNRLLIGCRFEDVMKYYNATAKKPMAHFHNMFLQIINIFGIPGLSIVLAFYCVILKKGLKIAFDTSGLFPIEEVMQVLPILAISDFNILEAGLFTNMGFCQIVFFMWCGILVGTWNRSKTNELSSISCSKT